MSADRLAQIEAGALQRSGTGEAWAVSAEDVLALVEIAKAARALDAVLYANVSEWYGDPEWPEADNLRSALARLDSGAAE